MKHHPVKQGSDQWLALRGRYRCASEAPVIMGVSNNMTRAEWVRMKALGQVKEFSAWAQRNLLDKGHEIEEAARVFVEEDLGEILYPVTASDDANQYLCSYDGLVMDAETAWECKMWNEVLVKAVKRGEVPEANWPQLESYFVVNERLKRVLFTVSDGTRENTITTEYRPVSGRRETLIRSWDQAEEDVKNYQHVEVLPAAVTDPIKSLPALIVQIDGAVKSSNLAIYRESALAFVDQIKTDLQTDDDFAAAENTIKFCDNAEKELATVKRHALGQTASIDELFKTIDTLSEAMRQKRLMLDKLVKARKETIRADILRDGVAALAKHVDSLNTRLGRAYMPQVVGQFAEVMKNKRTIQSLRDAVSTEISRVKILANEIADRIDGNLKAYAEKAKDKEFLFTDLASLVNQPPESFVAIVENRVRQHAEQEWKKQEDARACIIAEERTKIEREQAAKRSEEAQAERARTLADQRAADVAIAEAKAKADAEAHKLRVDAEAKLHEEMKAKRLVEEAKAEKEREAKAKEARRLGALQLLIQFTERFGNEPEFAAIAVIINKFLATREHA